MQKLGVAFGATQPSTHHHTRSRWDFTIFSPLQQLLCRANPTWELVASSETHLPASRTIFISIARERIRSGIVPRRV